MYFEKCKQTILLPNLYTLKIGVSPFPSGGKGYFYQHSDKYTFDDVESMVMLNTGISYLG